MKKLLFFLLLVAVTLIAHSQNSVNVKAMLPGYKTNDTIRLADFLKLSELTLNNKEYTVVRFTLFFSDGKSDFEEVSNSNKITDKMKNGLSKLMLNNTKPRIIAFKDISVQSAHNSKPKIDNLIYVLK